MSQLTAKLMGEKSQRGDRWPNLLAEVADRLVKEYGTPLLGNFRDPIKEIFYILLSARTSEVLYMRAFENLFSKYPNIKALAKADCDSVLKCVGGAGLGRKRSQQVIEVAKRILSDLGEDPEKTLRSMAAEDVFGYLTKLPGVGPKSALCVMMWSLDVDVFPVDVNVQRIAARLGVIPEGLKHYQAQQRLPKYVPSGRSLELHTGFMVHGREVCVPGVPKCEKCVLLDLCRTGRKVAAKTKVETKQV